MTPKERYRVLSLYPADPSPWASWAQQSEALDHTLSVTAALRKNGHRPVVEIDLDLTALLAVNKAIRTLQELAPTARELTLTLGGSGTGWRQDLANELYAIWTDPVRSGLCVPGYTDGAIEGYGIYIARTLTARAKVDIPAEVEETVAEWVRATVHAALRTGYWDRDLLKDEFSPGLVGFLAELYRQGGEAVFLSNRPVETREASLARLSAAVAEAGVHLANDPASIPLFVYFGPGGSAFDAPSKEVAQAHLELSPPPGLYAARVDAGVITYPEAPAGKRSLVVVAVFDDRAENRRLIIRGAVRSTALLQQQSGTGIASVALATIGHSAEVDVVDAPFVIASFERKPNRSK